MIRDKVYISYDCTVQNYKQITTQLKNLVLLCGALYTVPDHQDTLYLMIN